MSIAGLRTPSPAAIPSAPAPRCSRCWAISLPRSSARWKADSGMAECGGRAWLTLALMSALYFIITAATFGSLGMVLPAMVKELGWSWTGAGFGFSLLGFFCGITSAVPAALIRRFGVRATLLAGCVVMGLAFACLARTGGLLGYFAGASLAGLGFTLLD